MLLWTYQEDMKQISSGSTNHNNFGRFFAGSACWSNLNKLQNRCINSAHSVLVIVNIAGNVLVCVIIVKNRDMRNADKKKGGCF